ncbi:hypothetical protein BKA93DRAFT_809950 [Sparassis latifolia]
MSFQHFRLQPLAPQPQPVGVNVANIPAGPSSLVQTFGARPDETNLQAQADLQKKGPYGSGDADDGYTLRFESMAAFQEWRAHEEEEKMIEFVKGDTHGSKAVPPRFKDHTKLVCARHSRSGRKKYVKKFPDRVRKVPSRKLDGVGCPASISFKTYFDTEEIRACYVSEHSHEIGLGNFPFTKRGRKAQAEQNAHATRARNGTADDSNASSTSPMSAISPGTATAIAGPLSAPSQSQLPLRPPAQGAPQTFQSAISMLAPLPQVQPLQASMDLSQDRWDRMSVLFGSIREHARTFEYPSPSIAALESVLIRLYLESPVVGMASAGPLDGMDGIAVNGLDPGQVGT